MTRESSARRLGAVAGKTLFGLFVFVSTTVAWSQFGDALLRHRPLPGADGPEGPCAIWFVGSSSVHRWTTMGEDMAPWIVHNRGVNGARLDEVASRLAVEEVTRAPGTVVFYIGENDIAKGASATDLSQHLSRIVLDVRNRMPGVRVDVIGLKPTPGRWHSRPEQLRFNRLMRDFAQREARVTFLDVGGELLVNGRPGPFYQEDGIHLDATGYRVWGQAVRRAFEASLPSAAVARCVGRRRTAA